MKRGCLFLLSLLALQTAYGQVRSVGKWMPDVLKKEVPLDVSEKAIFVLPPLDNQQLQLAAQAERSGPMKFAQAINMRVSMENGDGEWVVEQGNEERGEEGVRKWRAIIHSTGATSLSLMFDAFWLPDDGEFYVIGKDPVAVYGAYTGPVNNKEDGKFAVQPIVGDTLIMEYVEPLKRQTDTSKPVIVLGAVAHGFKSIEAGESGSCNIDVRCPIGKPYVSKQPKLKQPP